MTKPFRITKPGRYLTRGGREVVIDRHDIKPPDSHSEWSGTIQGDGTRLTWASNGHWREYNIDDLDLIRRLPAPKPRKRTAAKRAQWGVWVPCKDREQARDCAGYVYSHCIHRNRKPVVKRSAP